MSNDLGLFFKKMNNKNIKRIDRIITHKNIDEKSPEYLVKLCGLSYRESIWIKESDFEKYENGNDVLFQFNINISDPCNEPPFYNPEYDVIERVLREENSEYLIKWKGLPIYDSTWIKDIPDEYINEFHKKICLKSISKQYCFLLIDSYEFRGEKIDSFSMSMLNSILFMFSQNRKMEIHNNFCFHYDLPLLSFFDFVIRNGYISDPILYVSSENRIENIIHKVDSFSYFDFRGNLKSREFLINHCFKNSNEQYLFHLLFITPEILSLEQKNLNNYKWSIVVVDGVPSYDKVSSVLNGTFFIQIDHDIDILQNICSKNILGNGNGDNEIWIATGVTVETIYMTLSPSQQFLCKKILNDFKNNIMEGDFIVPSNMISKLSFHPFLLYGGQSKIQSNDVYNTSSLFLALNQTFDSISDQESVLICFSFPYLVSILMDYFDSIGKNISFFHHHDTSAKIVMFCSSLSVEFPTYEQFNYLMIIDEDYTEWIPIIKSIPNNCNLKVFLFCTFVHRSLRIPIGLSKDDYICRQGAFESLIETSGDPLAKPLSTFSIDHFSKNSLLFPSNLADKEMCYTGFWTKYFEFSTPLEEISESRTSINESHEWNPVEINQLLRSISFFGLENIQGVKILSGLNIDDAYLDSCIRYVIKAISQNQTEHNQEMGHQIPDDSLNNFYIGLSKSRFKNIEQFGPQVLCRIEKAYYIKQIANTDSTSSLIYTNCPKPSEWWTEKHDEALIKGSAIYGHRNFEMFCFDENHYIREIMRIKSSRKDWFRILNRRITIIIKEEKFRILQRIYDNSNDDNIDDFSIHDKEKVFHHMISFGVPLDDFGNRDYHAFCIDVGLRQHEERIHDYVEKILFDDDQTRSRASSTVKIQNRVLCMNYLRRLLHSSELSKLIQKSTKWVTMPDTWSLDMELYFFKQLFKNGIGSQESILSQSIFKPCFLKGFKIVKTSSILTRISFLHDLAIQKHILQPFANPFDKGRKSIQKYKIPGSNIEFPIMISPTSSVLCLGTIIFDRPDFHSERYIYPAGFRSSRYSASLDNPELRVRWINEIFDSGEPHPIFRVWQEDKPGIIFNGNTPTAPWSHALKAVAQQRKEKTKISSISGPEAFLLASPLIIGLIQQLPNAEKCDKYVMRQVSSNTVQRIVSVEQGSTHIPQVESSDFDRDFALLSFPGSDDDINEFSE